MEHIDKEGSFYYYLF